MISLLAYDIRQLVTNLMMFPSRVSKQAHISTNNVFLANLPRFRLFFFQLLPIKSQELNVDI